MLDQNTFQEWTSVFSPGSHFEGEWDEGEQIHFLDAEENGLLSVVEVCQPHEHLSIRHIGAVRKGLEDLSSPEVRAWAPTYERYTLSEKEGETTLKVECQTAPEYEGYLVQTWPRALKKLKKMSELLVLAS